MPRIRSYLLVFALIFGYQGFSQSCIDPFNVNPTYPCPTPDFYPVCGCDNKTYRNLCEAQYRNGVTRYVDGPCDGLEIDILPNYTNSTLTFTMVQTSNPTFIRLFIIDAFGKLCLQQNVSLVYRFSSTIDVTTFLTGVYFIFAYDSKGNYAYRRFVKYTG